MKPFWKSKVFWVNVLSLGLAVGNGAGTGVDLSVVPDVDPALLALANLILRAFTTRGVSFR